MFKVGLVALLGPGLIWAASDKEVRLLHELENRSRQLDQRVRENKALNRMTQAHLADCLTDEPVYHPAPEKLRLLPAAHEVFTEPAPIQFRSDVKNVMVLDPEDNNYDRRYFEAAAPGPGSFVGVR